ncbi:MAG TPA: histidine kinase [Burkholderiaceae bacterium]|nr:histidine kinase [Burkholderiaceae bacterium]
MPTATADAEDPTTASPADPGTGAWRGWRAAALVGLFISLYEIGAHFRQDVFGLRLLADLTLTLVVNFIVAYAMLWLIGRAFDRAAPRAVPRWSGMALALGQCVLAGWSLFTGATLVRALAIYRIDPTPYLHGKVPLFLLCLSTSLAALVLVATASAARSRAAAHAWQTEEMRRALGEREAMAARSALLQAQIEPHFIFNALANARRLLRTDTAAARALLGNLLRYLQEALPALRDGVSTLGREGELVRAYLAVHQVRMGERLQALVDIPPALAARSLPPMVLLTLVENALKHGLQPLVEGGNIVVQARQEGARLVIRVSDDGRGMGSGSGQGTGLANVRARLRATYGAGATLTLAVNEPRGVVATIAIPDPA